MLIEKHCPSCSRFFEYELDENSVEGVHTNPLSHIQHGSVLVGCDGNDKLFLHKDVCPHCHRIMLSLSGDLADGGGWADPNIYPLHPLWHPDEVPPILSEVPDEFADDYKEALRILHVSPRGSAALSRALMERILVEKAGARGGNLKQDIEAAVQSKVLPTLLSKKLHSLRKAGNSALHQRTSEEASRSRVRVGLFDALYCLEVVQALLAHYFAHNQGN